MSTVLMSENFYLGKFCESLPQENSAWTLRLLRLSNCRISGYRQIKSHFFLVT